MGLDYDKVKNWPQPLVTQEYSERDSILYALGLGAAMSNPPAAEDLRYVYEGVAGGELVALPTMSAVLALPHFWMQDPEAGIDWQKILHGEQFLRMHAPMPAKGRVRSQCRIEEIYDKGADKGAVLIQTRDLIDDATGTLIATIGASVFMRGNGGFGGKSEGAPKPHALPADRAPDAILELQTRPEMAAIYRLSGDYNPLHVDGAVANNAGFPVPILHGMATYGIAGRAIIKLLCAHDASRLRVLNCRFANPVFPGETIRTEIWHQGEGIAGFRCVVVERDLIVLNNGYVEFSK